VRREETGVIARSCPGAAFACRKQSSGDLRLEHAVKSRRYLVGTALSNYVNNGDFLSERLVTAARRAGAPRGSKSPAQARCANSPIVLCLAIAVKNA
jgi:hypothetical protein